MRFPMYPTQPFFCNTEPYIYTHIINMKTYETHLYATIYMEHNHNIYMHIYSCLIHGKTRNVMRIRSFKLKQSIV